MARQFGIITTPAGTVTGLVVTSFTSSTSAEIAEARNEQGYVTDLKAYSKGTSISVRGLLDSTDVTVSAGDTFSLSGKDYIIESVNRTESNTAYIEIDFSARTADAAVISAYTAPAATPAATE